MLLKKTLIKIFPVSFVICFLVNSQVFSEPAVTDISGTISHKDIINISGNKFGTKNPAAPLIWADFENGKINPSPLGQRTSWNVVENLKVTDISQSGNSNFNVVGIWDSNKNKKSFSFRTDKTISQGYWSKIYHYQKRYFNFDVTANHKFWRLWPDPGITNVNNFLALWSNTGRCYNEGEGYAGGVMGSYQGKPPEKNRWYIEEFIWQHSGGTGKNLDGSIRWKDPNNHSMGYYSGIWEYTRNGVQIQHRENVDNGQKNHSQLRTDNFTDSRYLPPDGSKVYMDDIYIDDTYARVMIGNQKTLSASTHREIQIPSAWSDSSITITVNQGSFSDGDTAYIYVVDSSGNASRGFPIIIGGGPSSTTSTINMDEELELKRNKKAEIPVTIKTPYLKPELVWLPREIDLTKHTMGSFTVKVRMEGIDKQKPLSIIPRLRYSIGTGNSYGDFDMIHEKDNLWKFDIPDPKWYKHRSKTLYYQVRLFDEEGSVIAESNWKKELIDSFVQK